MQPVTRALALSTVLVLASAIPASLAHRDISATEAHNMILTDESLIVLDVREYTEFCPSPQHIKDAVNLPYLTNVLDDRYTELPDDVKIIVVCLTGARSHVASTFLDSKGYTQIYDMLGGMGAWEWETEPCDPEPVLTLLRDGSDLRIDWTPTNGSNAQDYDLLRGDVENLTDAVTFIDPGPTDCLADDSPYTYAVLALPPAGTVHFFLARQKDGSWGQSSGGLERIPASPDCD